MRSRLGCNTLRQQRPRPFVMPWIRLVSERALWFEQLRARFAGHAAVGIDALYVLQFSDAAPYQMRIRGPELWVAERNHEPATVGVLFDTFAGHCAILDGRSDPMQAFLDGRFRSDGHIVLVMRMLQLFVPQYAATGPEQLR